MSGVGSRSELEDRGIDGARGQPRADSQQGDGFLSGEAAKNCILPTPRMNMEYIFPRASGKGETRAEASIPLCVR